MSSSENTSLFHAAFLMPDWLGTRGRRISNPAGGKTFTATYPQLRI
jgi:hypothetical protein